MFLSDVVSEMHSQDQWKALQKLQTVQEKWASCPAIVDAQPVPVSPPTVAEHEMSADALYNAFRKGSRENDNSWKHYFLSQEGEEVEEALQPGGFNLWLEKSVNFSVQQEIFQPKPPVANISPGYSHRRGMRSESLMKDMSVAPLDARSAFQNITTLLQPRVSNAIAAAAHTPCIHCNRLPSFVAGATYTVVEPLEIITDSDIKRAIPKDLRPVVANISDRMWKEVAEHLCQFIPPESGEEYFQERAVKLEDTFEKLLATDPDAVDALLKLRKAHAAETQHLETLYTKNKKALDLVRMEFRVDDAELLELETALGTTIKDKVQTMYDIEKSLQEAEEFLYLINSEHVDAEIRRKALKKDLAKAEWSDHQYDITKLMLIDMLTDVGVSEEAIEGASITSIEPLAGVVLRYREEVIAKVRDVFSLAPLILEPSHDKLDKLIETRFKNCFQAIFDNECQQCHNPRGSSKFCPLTGRVHEELEENHEQFHSLCVHAPVESVLIEELESQTVQFPPRRRRRSSVARAENLAASQRQQEQEQEETDSDAEFGRKSGEATPTHDHEHEAKSESSTQQHKDTAVLPPPAWIDHIKFSNSAAANVTAVFVKELRQCMSGAPLYGNLTHHYKKSLQKKLKKAPRYHLNHNHMSFDDVPEAELEMMNRVGEALKRAVDVLPQAFVSCMNPREEIAKKVPPIKLAPGTVDPVVAAAIFNEERMLKIELDRLHSMLSVAHVPLKDLLAQAVELEEQYEDLQGQLNGHATASEQHHAGGDASELGSINPAAGSSVLAGSVVNVTGGSVSFV